MQKSAPSCFARASLASDEEVMMTGLLALLPCCNKFQIEDNIVPWNSDNCQPTFSTAGLRDLQPSDGHAARALQEDILALSAVLPHRPHPVDGHPRRQTGNRQRTRFLVGHVLWCPHQPVLGKHAMGRQHAGQWEPETRGHVFRLDLAREMGLGEGRQDAVPDLPGGDSLSDFDHDTAHVGAGDDGRSLMDSLVVVVEAHGDLRTCESVRCTFSSITEPGAIHLQCHGS